MTPDPLLSRRNVVVGLEVMQLTSRKSPRRGRPGVTTAIAVLRSLDPPGSF
jgi:hypothetical protein